MQTSLINKLQTLLLFCCCASWLFSEGDLVGAEKPRARSFTERPFAYKKSPLHHAVKRHGMHTFLLTAPVNPAAQLCATAFIFMDYWLVIPVKGAGDFYVANALIHIKGLQMLGFDVIDDKKFGIFTTEKERWWSVSIRIRNNRWTLSFVPQSPTWVW